MHEAVHSYLPDGTWGVSNSMSTPLVPQQVLDFRRLRRVTMILAMLVMRVARVIGSILRCRDEGHGGGDDLACGRNIAVGPDSDGLTRGYRDRGGVAVRQVRPGQEGAYVGGNIAGTNEDGVVEGGIRGGGVVSREGVGHDVVAGGRAYRGGHLVRGGKAQGDRGAVVEGADAVGCHVVGGIVNGYVGSWGSTKVNGTAARGCIDGGGDHKGGGREPICTACVGDHRDQ